MQWICLPCAQRAGSKVPDGHIATWHMGTCDVCRKQAPVTEPRDFRPRPDQRKQVGPLDV